MKGVVTSFSKRPSQPFPHPLPSPGHKCTFQESLSRRRKPCWKAAAAGPSSSRLHLLDARLPDPLLVAGLVVRKLHTCWRSTTRSKLRAVARFSSLFPPFPLLEELQNQYPIPSPTKRPILTPPKLGAQTMLLHSETPLRHTAFHVAFLGGSLPVGRQGFTRH